MSEQITVWSGYDRKACRDWSGWVAEWLEDLLPRPEISPTCKRKGHEWSEALETWPASRFRWGANIQGCKRCAKRGLIVVRTNHLAPDSNQEND